ncbi:hypothetical protein A3D85_02560 [Candidatus Amesbacteria bacterium RIFCSPHIGHO2_02_FULL_47_9]|uniref:Uncharacterized protein n=1 Tax=Candidatus Amesbacteria bacterium RIFCSPHIGHO2_01_FULL_48_32b TaxID=1797253 RepID=A0A1F4YEY1_9BACT|nr:MAG: hypothetical protein A2876_04705 [Candidatus Amesbacteria bacterium RIFCSPHIGHO2_01_FULL_48_32b]OGD04694.1 MAG: hypothetical protein A3D85_02560 [Candidatus Amesbacteria bacterium RIFCSPHIGHO2_02_FULL_47_9]OGD08405.1 MAG: hypothetical protein A2899_00430 [Candidatus Amesbacteria bacterium RIFCSPLOWO2_01_FULL_49_25]
MNRKDANPPKAGMVAAERYAGFFLENPLVAVAHIFGSVALREDGHDVDMILQMKDENLGFAFLQAVYDHTEEIIKLNKKIPDDDYNNLKYFRMHTAYSILGMQDAVRSYEFIDIEWGGKWQEWNDLIRQIRYSEAQEVENESLRGLDLFLMPPGWHESKEVCRLLPNWSSDRPWAKRSFYDIMVLQSRRYNTQTQTFELRRKGSRKEETLLRKALRQEKKIHS